jgi:hypothetical protein
VLYLFILHFVNFCIADLNFTQKNGNYGVP